mgnify:CR=1 FL=1
MAQLYFKYGAMGSSKTANALMARFNYEERGQKTLLVKPRLDQRDGDHMVHSRIGLEYPCIYFDEMLELSENVLKENACIIVDEAQFLSKEDVDYLVHVVDDLGVPVICYGLRADFKGELFPGSYELLVMADKLEEVKTICWCGKKAMFNARFDENGKVLKEGAQVVLGANDKYIGGRETWGRISMERARETDDLQPLSPPVRRGAAAGQGWGRVRNAQPSGGGPGYASPVGGALSGGGARCRGRVFLRLQPPVQILPERHHFPGGLWQNHHAPTALGNFPGAGGPGGSLPGPGDPYSLYRCCSGGPGRRALAGAGGLELRRL